MEQNDQILGGIVLCENFFKIYSNPLFVKYLGILYGEKKVIGPDSKRRKIKSIKL